MSKAEDYIVLVFLILIASGGIATPEHVHELAGLQRDNLEGAIVGKALYDGRTTYEELSAAIA